MIDIPPAVAGATGDRGQAPFRAGRGEPRSRTPTATPTAPPAWSPRRTASGRVSPSRTEGLAFPPRNECESSTGSRGDRAAGGEEPVRERVSDWRSWQSTSACWEVASGSSPMAREVPGSSSSCPPGALRRGSLTGRRRGNGGSEDGHRERAGERRRSAARATAASAPERTSGERDSSERRRGSEEPVSLEAAGRRPRLDPRVGVLLPVALCCLVLVAAG